MAAGFVSLRVMIGCPFGEIDEVVDRNLLLASKHTIISTVKIGVTGKPTNEKRSIICRGAGRTCLKRLS